MNPLLVALALTLGTVGVGPANHDGYGCNPDYEDCYGPGSDYSQDYSSEDRNRNRGRNRGSFSPGPFDRSPIDMRNACISLDCSGREPDRRDREEPQ